MNTRDIESKKLELYSKAINQIDDYFEYRNESKKDREVVYKILDDLSASLKLLIEKKKNPYIGHI
jgi:hypothetical protein